MSSPVPPPPADSEIRAFIDAEKDRFTALSDNIWDLAEIGYEEHGSAAAQCAVLKHYGFDVEEKLAGMATAFIGESKNPESDGPVIAFLGEFDALPGLHQCAGLAERQGDGESNGHACGHHLLGSGALLAAVATADFLRRHRIPARVRYYGCPAEENGIGKAFLVRAGFFDDVSAALTWHPGAAAGVMTGPILANIQAYFRFKGRAAHAATVPHLGRSALDAVELMNVGVNYLREHMPPDARVHYAITDSGGHAPNVVQARAEVLYLVRSETAAELKSLYQRVVKIAEGASLMTETQVEVRVDKATAPMLHNAPLDQHLSEIIAALGVPRFSAAEHAEARQFQASLSPQELAAGKRKFLIAGDYEPALVDRVMPYLAEHPSVGGSTDVADVSWKVPTAQCWSPCFAIGTPGHSWQSAAQGKTAYAHRGMLHAARILAVTALDLIARPEILNAARQALDASLARLGSPDLLPDSVMPPPPRARHDKDASR